MARHMAWCWDDQGKLDCCCGLEGFDTDRTAGLSALYVDLYDPDDVGEGRDPLWRERDL